MWRAGQKLLVAHVLFLEEGQLGIEKAIDRWSVERLAPLSDAARQLWMTEGDVAWEQRQSLPASNAAVAAGQRKRCLEAPVFRRAKDRCKDKLKTYIKTVAASDVPRHRVRNGALNEHPAGAARPIPGKYDGT